MQILASSKTGINKYDLKSNDPNKVFPRLDARQMAQSFQTLYEISQGYCLSGDEGSSDALVNDLSIIDVSNIGSYTNDLSTAIQTLVANASRLESDAGSTANAIILNPPKIAPGNSPNGTDYSKTAVLPFKYREGLRFTFRATTTNTGATTINIPLLADTAGALDVVDANGNNLPTNKIIADNYYTIVCQEFATVKKFILIDPSIEVLDIYESPAQTIVNGGLVTLAHGLPSIPKDFQPLLRCNIAENGYVVNDIVALDGSQSSSASFARGVSIRADATNIYLRFGTGGIEIIRADNGSLMVINNANWEFIIKVGG